MYNLFNIFLKIKTTNWFYYMSKKEKKRKKKKKKKRKEKRIRTVNCCSCDVRRTSVKIGAVEEQVA